MTLQQLEYIVAVHRCRHFAKAAEQCGVTQPTLSALIQKLETELGVKLFERSAQQVTPTLIGQKVVAQAEVVLTQAGRVKELVKEEKHSLTGDFRIGILPTIAPYLLPRFFSRLRKEHPETNLHVIELKTNELLRRLREGEVDAAIVVDWGKMDEFEKTELYYEQFVAYVSRESRLSACKAIRTADLASEPLWLLDEGHCFRDQLVKFCNLKSARESQMAYSLGSIETFMRMVESGQGVTFIPELALDQLTEQQKELVRPFALPIPTRSIVLLTTRDFVRRSLHDLLVMSIMNSVPARMLKLNNTEQRV